MIKEIVKKFPFIPQLVKYGVIGCFSASVDIATFHLSRLAGVPLYIANFIGINIGICISFFLNARFNFKKTDRMFARGIKFFGVGYCGLLLSMGIMYIGVDIMGIREIMVKILSVPFIVVLQFTLNKLVSFK